MSIYAINFIKSSDIEAARHQWENISQKLIQHPGIISVHLFQVFKNLNEQIQVDYQLVSLIECKTQAEYEAAKKNLFSQPSSAEEKIGIQEKATFCKAHFSLGLLETLQFNPDKIVVINRMNLPNEQIKDYLEHWHLDAKTMKVQDGFSGVNFLEAIDLRTSQIKFINIAEWQDEVHLKAALAKAASMREENAIHRKRAESFLSSMAPAFCRHISGKKSISNNP